MSLVGHFKIDVRGRPRSRMWAEVMRSQIHGILENKVMDLRGEETWFSDIAVVYKWTGKIEKFRTTEYLLKLLTRLVRNYFTTWKFSLEINFIDTEEGKNAPS